MLNLFRRVGERYLADVNQLVDTCLTVKDELEPVPRDELMQRVKQGLVTVIDMRPVEEFAAGHVPGAINVPPADLEKHLQALDPSQEVVAYCRGAHCILSFDAVQKLRMQGIKASRMEDGFPEWKSAG